MELNIMTQNLFMFKNKYMKSKIDKKDYTEEIIEGYKYKYINI